MLYVEFVGGLGSDCSSCCWLIHHKTAQCDASVVLLIPVTGPELHSQVRMLYVGRLQTAHGTEDPTWEFNPESGALGVARCPSGALSGALIRASSGTVWSRDLQASRGQ
jgi:hypothetical protein